MTERETQHNVSPTVPANVKQAESQKAKRSFAVKKSRQDGSRKASNTAVSSKNKILDSVEAESQEVRVVAHKST